MTTSFSANPEQTLGSRKQSFTNAWNQQQEWKQKELQKSFDPQIGLPNKFGHPYMGMTYNFQYNQTSALYLAAVLPNTSLKEGRRAAAAMNNSRYDIRQELATRSNRKVDNIKFRLLQTNILPAEGHPSDSTYDWKHHNEIKQNFYNNKDLLDIDPAISDVYSDHDVQPFGARTLCMANGLEKIVANRDEKHATVIVYASPIRLLHIQFQ